MKFIIHPLGDRCNNRIECPQCDYAITGRMGFVRQIAQCHATEVHGVKDLVTFKVGETLR